MDYIKMKLSMRYKYFLELNKLKSVFSIKKFENSICRDYSCLSQEYEIQDRNMYTLRQKKKKKPL